MFSSVSSRSAGSHKQLIHSQLVLAGLVVVLCSLAARLLRSRLTLTDLAMIYLLGVIAISIQTGRRVAILACFASVASFHYFCVPMFDSFVLTDAFYVSTLLGMLAVSLVISTLATRIREEAAAARDAEVRIEAERLKNSLLSAVSHDLKTPLTSIYVAATSLLEQAERLDNTDRRELAENIAHEAERLNRLLSNILEMTRLDSGVEVQKAWQSLEEIVGSALNRMDQTLGDRQVHVRIPSRFPLMWVDDVLIEQVIINLLENIAKYTPSGTAIEIIAAHNGDRAIVSVQDRGPGFAPGEHERIFEKFYRATHHGGGVGLGLAICRAIVEAHEGTISAENRKDGGAVVHIELPIGGVQPQIAAES